MIPTGELAQLRADATAVLPDTCAVQRPGASVSDGAGGWVAGAAATVATVACALAPVAPGGEGTAGGRIVAEADWVLTLPALTDVLTTDLVVRAGRTYEVLGVGVPRTWEVTRRVWCREARP